MKPILSPKDLAEAIGVSESSIKRWVDDELIRATRTAGGHRRIPASEAIRFVRESRSVLLKPEVLGLSDLAALHGSRPAQDEEADALHEYLRRGAAAEARGMILSLYLSGRTVGQIIDGPVRQAMQRFGEHWRDDEAGIFLEHCATDIAIQAVNRLRSLFPIDAGAPTAAGGAPPADPYILPSLSVAAVLEGQGVNAVNLGPDTPMSALKVAADSLRVRMVWLSVTSIDGPDDLPKQVQRLFAYLQEKGTPLIVGGSKAEELDLAPHALLYVGGSMVELEALVRGLQLSSDVEALSA
jgi:excisionase family DNA binding protein